MKRSYFVLLFFVGLIHEGIMGTTEIILSNVQADDNSQTDEKVTDTISEPFIPTNEWQVVKDNQHIPAGLHVRMNFQTGIKEAKLLDEEDDGTQEKKEDPSRNAVKSPKIILSDEAKDINDFPKTDEKLYFTKSHLKQALNEFRDKVGTKEIVDDITWSQDARDALNENVNQEPVKQKFRTIDEIRAELEDTMGWKIKSDIEVMKEQMRYLLSSNQSVGEKEAALDGLEYYVHQLDNAKDLDRIGGLEQIVLLLNNSNELLQEKAANVIGAASQSNKEVQDSVLQHGGLSFLLRMVHSAKLALTRKKGLYALSALVRGNAKAQKQFVKLNGIQKVLEIIKSASPGLLKVKAVTLLFDLIVEQNEAIDKLVEVGKMSSTDERSPLMKLLLENNWCNLLLPLMETTDYDTKEKVMQALSVSIKACKDVLKNDHVIRLLATELKLLDENIASEDDIDFKSYLQSLRTQLDENIIQQLNI